MLLVYRFGAPNEGDFELALQKLSIEYKVLGYKMKDYHADAEFAALFIDMIHTNKIDKVFSYDYFPLISMLCEMNQIPYISWIFDCPLTTLQSKTLGNNQNYIFCFDRLYTQKLICSGAKHCIHFPLGVRSEKRTEIDYSSDTGACDCSFIGNLYNERKNRIRHTEFSDYTRGFIEGLYQSQKDIYGYNLIYEALTQRVVDEISKRCDLFLSDCYQVDQRQMVTNAINKELAAREREDVLKTISQIADIDLYTGSTLPPKLSGNPKIKLKGYADYDKKMPLVFQNSKVNLNITSRSIESGISLRVLDILSVGGFCLTNYQLEIAEFFEEDKEIVMYHDLADLAEKLSWYLSHDKERELIREAGFQKVKMMFSLEQKIIEMLRYIEEVS